jgi:hypothetical protein
MRKNWLTTLAGIMAAMITVPVAVIGLMTTGMYVPHWWGSVQFIFVVIGAVGTALLGFAAKGQDEHSTVRQVELSTIHAAVDAEASAAIAQLPNNKSAGA